MIKGFNEYVTEGRGKTAAITFGRFNPPTTGHEKLINVVAKQDTDDYFIFASRSHDAKKNPLQYNSKLKHMRKMFPKHARSIVDVKGITNILGAAVHAHDKGYENLVVVVGSDRVNEFKKLLLTYNGKDLRHGYYNFTDISVVSAGTRDPDAEGVSGMSASKMRKAVIDNDFASFQKGLPKNYSAAAAMFKELSKEMGVDESIRKHVKLAEISEAREQYARGELFNVGDKIHIISENIEGVVAKKKPNYVIIRDVLGRLRKEWINNIQEKH